MLEWAEHHKEDPPPPEDDENKEKRTDDIEPWDQEFLRVDQGTLFELILVSTFTASIVTSVLCRLLIIWTSKDYWMSLVRQ